MLCFAPHFEVSLDNIISEDNLTVVCVLHLCFHAERGRSCFHDRRLSRFHGFCRGAFCCEAWLWRIGFQGGWESLNEHASDVVKGGQSVEQPAKDWILVNPRMLVGLVGAVACYAWLFIMLGTSVFLGDASVSDEAISAGHVSCVVGVIVALAISWAFSNAFSGHRLVQFGLAVILACAGCVGSYFAGVYLWAVSLSSLFLGMGFGFLYPLYGEFICLFFYGYVRPYVHGVFLCAAIACGGLLFAGVEMGFFFSVLFPIVAFVAYLFELVLFRMDERPVIDRKESDDRTRVRGRSYLATVTSGMAAGFAFGCLTMVETSQSWAYVLVEALVFATCLFLFIDSLKWCKVNETVTMRLFLPGAAIVVFPLMFVPHDFRFVFALLLLCGSLCPTTCSISAICKHIVICDLSAVRAFSFGRMMSFFGLLLGMGLAFVGFGSFGRAWFGELVMAASVVAFMVLVIFSASFVMTEDNYPDESRFRVRDEKEGEGLEVAPGTPIRKIAALVPDEVSASHVEEPVPSWPGLFHVKCEIASDRYGLSSRQREVLAMLAKGRNADYITEKLVISSHTAKAHIYNIYQKTGVHSRQELMDLVENVDVDEAAHAKDEQPSAVAGGSAKSSRGGGALIAFCCK